MSKDLSRLIQQQSSKKKNTIERERERMDILRATVRSKISDDNGAANSLTRIITFEISGQIVVETGKLAFTNKSGTGLTITGVYARVNTAPTGAAIEIDINKNGVSILPVALSIAAGATTASTTTISTAALAVDEYLTMDIDQAGDAGSGLDLVVQVVATQDAIIANVTNADTLDGVDSTGFALAAHTHASPLTVEEADGTPSVATVTKIKVANGTLTDNGSGVVTIATGGGGSLTVEEVDGTPSIVLSKLIVPNGSLTDDGSGQGTLTFGGGATDADAIHDNASGEISAITEKATPVANDMLLIEDSAASNAKKMIKISSLPAAEFTPSFPLTRTWSANRMDGILAYLATNAGRKPWSNPAVTDWWDGTTKYCTTTLSSQWYTNVAEFATDGLINSDSAHTNGDPNQWWKIDFGTRAILLTRFGMAARTSGEHYPRNWKLQGSNNNTDWDDLLTVVNDGPAAASWYSAAISTTTAYRYIRVYQTGANSSGAGYLTIGEVEFWGTLDEA